MKLRLLPILILAASVVGIHDVDGQTLLRYTSINSFYSRPTPTPTPTPTPGPKNISVLGTASEPQNLIYSTGTYVTGTEAGALNDITAKIAQIATQVNAAGPCPEIYGAAVVSNPTAVAAQDQRIKFHNLNNTAITALTVITAGTGSNATSPTYPVDHTTRWDVRLNTQKNWNNSGYSWFPSSGKWSMKAVIGHELAAHATGLGHNTDLTSARNPNNIVWSIADFAISPADGVAIRALCN